MKTPFFMQVLEEHAPRYEAKQEYNQRLAGSELTEDGIYRLIYLVTGDREKAELARAKLILRKARNANQYSSV